MLAAQVLCRARLAANSSSLASLAAANHLSLFYWRGRHEIAHTFSKTARPCGCQHGFATATAFANSEKFTRAMAEVAVAFNPLSEPAAVKAADVWRR